MLSKAFSTACELEMSAAQVSVSIAGLASFTEASTVDSLAALDARRTMPLTPALMNAGTIAYFFFEDRC